MSHDEATTELSSFPLKPCPFCGYEAFSECEADKHNYSRTGEIKKEVRRQLKNSTNLLVESFMGAITRASESRYQMSVSVQVE